MKILIVHNSYGRYSGEEAVVDKMVEIFRTLGYEVALYLETTEGARGTLTGEAKGFFCGLYSRRGVFGMREALQRERPDVVNVHNLYPFISPAALFECKRAGVPVVMTVHNFRLMCPTGLFMRSGKPCEHCLTTGNEWGCVRYNCEHSLLKSLGYAARNAVARWTKAYRDCVERFVCITDFQRRKLIEAGYGAGRITVIPNCIDIGHGEDTNTTGNYVAYLGRLSYEKGYDLLWEVARRHPEIQFRFAGAVREDTVIDTLDNVKLLGYMTGEALNEFLKGCRFIVMPSRWYEGFPMVILEAARYRKASVGPDHGGFTEIIGRGENAIGRLFEPGSFEDLERRIIELWQSPDTCQTLGLKAQTKLKRKYSTDVTSKQWGKLLEEVTKR